ncbi:PHP domain-containing protein [Halogranum rubrum]|uniref:Metal-dependent phosphoesterase, php family n=1 Tax=Halogranum salarium B-1 TaxID=1210908 RepID=J3EXJ8_9EURY|nr:PHP domain-containing protein [Halogranum salarium]EJN59847.1 metal-dependent phosphoesterase, php family [Halogranum salarium B-1]
MTNVGDANGSATGVPDDDSTAEETPAADLHLHTTVSDGTLTVSALPDAARAGGVDTVAVTDHDRVHPGLDAPVTVHDGVTVIRGIELRVDAGAQNVDLLGYAVDPTPALDNELRRLQENRKERARAIVACVENRLGVTLDVDIHDGIGRPHIARAIDASDADYDFQGAFDHLIGDGGPCYVARELPSFEYGVDLLTESCAVVGLAHPFRYPDPAAALASTDQLDAVERYYPYDAPPSADEVARLDALVESHDLLATGGSDAHDATLGRAGPPRAAFDRFAARLPRAEG